jgi:hypothetical protein
MPTRAPAERRQRWRCSAPGDTGADRTSAQAKTRRGRDADPRGNATGVEMDPCGIAETQAERADAGVRGTRRARRCTRTSAHAERRTRGDARGPRRTRNAARVEMRAERAAHAERMEMRAHAERGAHGDAGARGTRRAWRCGRTRNAAHAGRGARGDAGARGTRRTRNAARVEMRRRAEMRSSRRYGTGADGGRAVGAHRAEAHAEGGRQSVMSSSNGATKRGAGARATAPREQRYQQAALAAPGRERERSEVASVTE